MEGYTYLSSIIPDANVQKFTVGIAAGVALLAVGTIAARKLRQASGLQEAIAPSRFSLTAFFDLFFEAFLKYFDSILGKERRRFAPFCASVFIFVLTGNLLGLIPGMPAVTTTVWINVGMAFVVFFTFNWIGIREHGLIGYLKHFCGPILFVAPLVFPLEILSTCLRILTLNMRLYWNIFADHLVLGIFTSLTQFTVPIFSVPVSIPIPVPVIFYAMGAFVSFMQAFVFATLTMMYILLATQHEAHEEH